MKDRLHVLLQGHPDNVGDSVLRRIYADQLRAGRDLVIWPGSDRPGYLSGLRLGPDDRVARSMAAWWWSLGRDVLKGRAAVALNAGQYTVSPRYLLDAVLLLPLVALTRWRSGPVAWLGAAVPASGRGIWLYQALARRCTVVRWRDTETAGLIGCGGTMPDWAFLREGPPSHGARRRHLALVVRGDRPLPSQAWLDAVRGAAERLGLGVVAVSQVLQDADRASWLAEQLGGDHLPWAHDDHRHQEELVRDVYRRSELVLGDRLHGLVMALAEGAVALGWCEQSTSKLPRHFDHLGLKCVTLPAAGAVAAVQTLDPATLADLREVVEPAVAHASLEVERVAAELLPHLVSHKPASRTP